MNFSSFFRRVLMETVEKKCKTLKMNSKALYRITYIPTYKYEAMNVSLKRLNPQFFFNDVLKYDKFYMNIHHVTWKANFVFSSHKRL